jgi:hypothetical protein
VQRIIIKYDKLLNLTFGQRIKTMFKRQEEKQSTKVLGWMSIISGNIVLVYWLSELITEKVSFATFSRPALVMSLYALGAFLLNETKKP